MEAKYAPYADSVKAMRAEGKLRTLKPTLPINGAFVLFEDRKMLSFCSHDYLGIASHPGSKKQATQFLLEHGVATTTQARDLYLTCQQALEERLSQLLRRESTLFFPSRFEANVATLVALGHKEAAFFIDDASHPSCLIGASRSQGNVHTYSGEDLDQLRRLLSKAEAATKILVTESISSLTGAVAHLPSLIQLAKQFDALLFVDDSHALGTTGVEGVGLCAHLREIDIITGSLSKACGACGGLMASSEIFRDYTLSHNPMQAAFRFPPSIIGAIEAALDLIPQMEGERKQLEQRSHFLRRALQAIGFDLQKANTPLISLAFDDAGEGEGLQKRLEEEGILVNSAYSHPGGQSPFRLNLALNICHMPDHLTRLVSAITAQHTARST